MKKWTNPMERYGQRETFYNGAGKDWFPVKFTSEKTGDEADSRVKRYFNVQTK